MAVTVNKWDEILENAYEFNKVIDMRDSIAYKRFGKFSYWYYFPVAELFAPNKFLGYKGTTIKNYDGHGKNGGESRNALEPFFPKLNRETCMML